MYTTVVQTNQNLSPSYLWFTIFKDAALAVSVGGNLQREALKCLNPRSTCLQPAEWGKRLIPLIMVWRG